ncbi:galactosyltransferase-domain-containing protein [Jimgerdemannia flammicorona]|uniref:Galactosyltransferase-domain-containing protein n=1 Tax=Jimgerdemannia flammicorona TaxID=994334 RepID=A0A433DBZ2_9FUNG|nr:galactosyltransferase-domain-containing protein [Jimgerdemannia flammicorona]
MKCGLAGFWSWILTTSMMRRWLYHYELSNAIVRLVTLTAINWSMSAYVTSHYGHDQPIWAWMVICHLLLVGNVLKILLASNPKYHRKAEDVQEPRLNLKSTVVKYLVLPLTLVTFLTMVASLGEIDTLRYTSNSLMTQRFALAPDLSLADFPQAEVRILVVVLSSWTPKGYGKRQIFRETTQLLVPANTQRASVAFRFILGEAPSAKAQLIMGPKIVEETEKYGDLLIVPSSDLYHDLSRKVYKAMEWSDRYHYDYLVKTDDDIFVRFDTVVEELAREGRQRNIPPIRNPENKNAAFDYQLPMFPPFTAGALYILSRDVVHLIITDGPRLYTKNEDQNLGIWLFPYNIKPIHDRRIQQADVCEDDMIAKHFGDGFEIGGSMYDMYANIRNDRRLCHGFKQHFCALCYPCHGRSNHWREWNFECDDKKGITLLHQPPLTLEVEASKPVKDKSEDSVIGKNDEWIINGLLSQLTSTYSNTDNWHLLHWVCWTTNSSTFDDRHWHTIELIWIHQPRAVVFMLTTTLPDDFFDEYKRHGYQIHVIRFNKELLLKRRWYLGPDSHTWLRDWGKWEKGPYFFSHLTDYMRYLLLYKYGGTYMDMDALWIRAPPNSNMEWIGADFSNVKADTEWTLDDAGMYLAPGVMRFRKGWAAFREVAEKAFSPSYNPECFNCVGPRAITTYVRDNRGQLEDAGFTILPNVVLYPVNYMKIQPFLSPDPIANHAFRRLIRTSWSIHLFGKMTNHLPIQDGSVVRFIFDRFSLDIQHLDPRTKHTTSSEMPPFRLQGPNTYIYRPPSAAAPYKLPKDTSLTPQAPPGSFQGADVIYIRGGAARVKRCVISFAVTHGKLKIGSPSHGMDFTTNRIEMHDVMKRDVNTLLGTLLYTPPAAALITGGVDEIKVELEYGSGEGGGKAELDIAVGVAEVEEEGEAE